MIDAGHLILFVVALIFALFGLRKSKQATVAQSELANELFDKKVEGMKNETLSKPHGVMLDDINNKYSGSGTKPN